MSDGVVTRQTPHRWYLRTTALYPEARPLLDWLHFLPTGVGTKHQREYLVRSMKEFFAAWISLSECYGGVRHNTLKGRFNRLKRLARWMVGHEIWRPAQLSMEDMLTFIKELSQKKGGLATETIRVEIEIFEKMWLLRPRYCAALRVNPSGLFEELRRERVRLRRARTWKPLDETIALQIIKKSLIFIEKHGYYVADVMVRLWTLRDRMVGATAGQKRIASRNFCQSLNQERAFQELRLAIPRCPKNPYSALQRAASLTESACVTALLFLVGQRASELARLDAGCLKTSAEAKDALFHLEGVAAKRVRPKRWAVAHPVPAIIRLLEAMFEPSRKASGAHALFLCRPGATAFPPARGRKMRRWTAGMVSVKLRYFVKIACCDLKARPIHIHSHMGRKTFARFVALRDKRALESLAFHFGHVYRFVTDHYYVGVDIQLAELIAEESRKDLARGLAELLTSRRIGGKAGAALASIRNEVYAKFRGKLALSKLVERLIEEGVLLAPCDWGFCLYVPPYSACHGTASGPNEAERSPEICSGCPNFCVTPVHESWWRSRRDREIAFLDRPSLPEQTREVAQRRLRSTERILRELGCSDDEAASND